MIFGKLFGKRDEDEEPAAAPPPGRRVTPNPRPRPAADTGPAAVKPAALSVEAETAKSAPGGMGESRGFDPYNSGAFNKSRAWERIKRR